VSPIPKQSQVGAIGRLGDNVSAIDTGRQLTGIRYGHCFGEVFAAALDISDSWPGLSNLAGSTQNGKNVRIHMEGHEGSLDALAILAIFFTFTGDKAKYPLPALCLPGEQAFSDSRRGGIPSAALRAAQWHPAARSETADGRAGSTPGRQPVGGP
jgi:hypothetical protein